jgi:mycofactocin system glycosyltransferase
MTRVSTGWRRARRSTPNPPNTARDDIGVAVTELPLGFEVVFDPALRAHKNGRLLVGGKPTRVLRLTPDGNEALAALRTKAKGSKSTRVLARILIDAGMAHPRPLRASDSSVTVVIPVRDRVRMLRRCLGSLGATYPIVVVDDGSHAKQATATACAEAGATLVRLEPGGGAAHARNAALAHVSTDLVAFLDSDCVATPGWLTELMPEFADPLVGAVAPRVLPISPASPSSAHARFTSARSPLDMGDREGLVGPNCEVTYVPGAALVIRREALTEFFDTELQYGEDVDLVWRLYDSGWRIRYVPRVCIKHEEPRTWLALLHRRFRYGTSAAPLSLRHPERLSHLVLAPLPAVSAMLLLLGKPRATAAVTALHGLVLSHRARKQGLPPLLPFLWAGSGLVGTVQGVGRAARMFASPVLFAALIPRSTRRLSAFLLTSGPLAAWFLERPQLDPFRWTLACVGDDVAYGMGVLRGCAAYQTSAPLRPTRHRPASVPSVPKEEALSPSP